MSISDPSDPRNSSGKRTLSSNFYDGRSQLANLDGNVGEDSYKSNFRTNGPARPTGQRVELILVKIAHQPFALLMSQIYNIVRPQDGHFQLLRPPDPLSNRLWGEISYLDTQLRVLELTRMLHLPLVEPIESSRILLTGKLMPDGLIQEPYGLAVDDILAVQMLSLNELRLLPRWVCQKRLGQLIWAIALLDQTSLSEQNVIKDLSAQSGLASVRLSEFMVEAVGPADSALRKSADLTRLLPVNQPIADPLLSPKLLNPAFKPVEPSQQRPVMVLDVSQLKQIAYNY